MIKKCVIIGQMDNSVDHTFESANRIYGILGLSPAINTFGGGGLEHKILVKDLTNKTDGKTILAEQSRAEQSRAEQSRAEQVGIRQATEKGYIECDINGVADFSYPSSKLRRGRVQGHGQITPTLTVAHNICKVEKEKVMDEELNQEVVTYRIRKLTPKECWRLMGFTDEDFSKAAEVNSNTQLYKEAGNSIITVVLMAIFSQLHIQNIPAWNDLTEEEIYNLIESKTRDYKKCE